MKVVLMALLFIIAASAQSRRAFVVGNAGYPTAPLVNPVNDARDMATALTAAKFTVTTAIDNTSEQLERSVRTFTDQVNSGDVVFIYYAGHGIQIEGENYIVPIDFDARDEIEAKYAGYGVSRILDRVNARKPRLQVIVLDACRNNPFKAARSISRGLAQMQTGAGTYIAFATSPGSVAADNPRERNGLFTKHLLAAMSEPGVDIDTIFSKVRSEVFSQSMGRQAPWTSSSMIGQFYLLPSDSNGYIATSSRGPTDLPVAGGGSARDLSTGRLSREGSSAKRAVIQDIKQRQYDQALKALVSEAHTSNMNTLRGLLSVSQGDPYKTAMADLSEAIRQHEQEPHLRYWRALLSIMQKSYATAITDLDAIRGDLSQSADVIAARAAAYYGLGEVARAMADAERALSIESRNAVAQTILDLSRKPRGVERQR